MNGNSYYSLCRRSYESSKDTHGAGNSLDSRQEHSGDRLMPHFRARWLAGRSLQGAEYGPLFVRDSWWRGDRSGSGGAGGSGGGMNNNKDEIRSDAYRT